MIENVVSGAAKVNVSSQESQVHNSNFLVRLGAGLQRSFIMSAVPGNVLVEKKRKINIISDLKLRPLKISPPKK